MQRISAPLHGAFEVKGIADGRVEQYPRVPFLAVPARVRTAQSVKARVFFTKPESLFVAVLMPSAAVGDLHAVHAFMKNDLIVVAEGMRV